MAEKQLSPVYLFDGDDTLKREMLLKRLSKRLSEYGDMSLNAQQFSARELKSAAQLVSALNTLPFGSPYRLVVITEADQLDKLVAAALINYLSNPSQSTVVALVTEKLAANTRLYKTMKERYPASIVDCSQKKRSELPPVVRNIAKGEGVEIATNVASLIVDRLGTDTVLLHSETKKLAAIVKSRGDDRIQEPDVLRYVTRRTEPQRWDMKNALFLKKLSLCLSYVEEMKGFTAISLYLLCITAIREILTAKTVKARGLSVSKHLNKQEWQIKELLTATTLYSLDELKAILQQAPEIESQMKSGADADHVLRIWIINVCTGKYSTS